MGDRLTWHLSHFRPILFSHIIFHGLSIEYQYEKEGACSNMAIARKILLSEVRMRN